MRKKILKLRLIDIGYSPFAVKSLLNGNRKPKLIKAIELEEDHKIPCTIWKDIKSYLSDKSDNEVYQTPCSTTSTN